MRIAFGSDFLTPFSGPNCAKAGRNCRLKKRVKNTLFFIGGEITKKS
jgi:hypothetical protein